MRTSPDGPDLGPHADPDLRPDARPGFGPDLRAAKARIRAEVLAARRSAPAAARTAADATLREALRELVRRTAPERVAGYCPLPSEPAGPALPEALAAAGVPELLLPVLRDDRDLDWAPYRGPDSLRPSGRGLREPAGPRLGTGAISGVDLVVVPAVAVDLSGVRLGRGGGSYDRALSRVPASRPVIALLYDDELVDRLPAEPHDRRVSGVIQPTAGLVVLDSSAGRTAGE